jgi:hypothetical protein
LAGRQDRERTGLRDYCHAKRNHDRDVFEINPADPSDFKTGVIQARAMVTADVAVLHPAAVCISTSIT